MINNKEILTVLKIDNKEVLTVLKVVGYICDECSHTWVHVEGNEKSTGSKCDKCGHERFDSHILKNIIIYSDASVDVVEDEQEEYRFEKQGEYRFYIQQSINHWQVDIIDKFLDGDHIKEEEGNISKYWQDDSVVCDTCSSCSLCKKYVQRNSINVMNCDLCPLFIFYGHNCNYVDSFYSRWNRKPILKTALEMQGALKRLLNNEIIRY